LLASIIKISDIEDAGGSMKKSAVLALKLAPFIL
jgi:hypothetical protein